MTKEVEVLPQAAPMDCCQLESSIVENPSGTYHYAERLRLTSDGLLGSFHLNFVDILPIFLA